MDDDSASNSQCDSAGGLPEFTLRVRQTNGTIIEHSVASRALSVASLKQALSERTEIPVERMRLMLESTILADDNSLESYGKYNIHDGSVLRLVQLAGNHVQSHPQNVNGITSAPPAPPSSAQAMTNQARQLFLANPQLAQTFMMANPQMREALENNPELRRLMSDPEVMQQSFNAVQNPRLLQEVQRNNDRVLSNLESAPGGYAHIRRMYHSVQEPLARAAADDSMRMPLDELNRRRARMLGVVKPDPSRVNTTPLPNPWSSARPRAGSRSSAFDSRNPFAMMDQPALAAAMAAAALQRQQQQQLGLAAANPAGAVSAMQAQMARSVQLPGAAGPAQPRPAAPMLGSPSSAPANAPQSAMALAQRQALQQAALANMSPQQRQEAIQRIQQAAAMAATVNRAPQVNVPIILQQLSSGQISPAMMPPHLISFLLHNAQAQLTPEQRVALQRILALHMQQQQAQNNAAAGPIRPGAAQ
ncbi:hypothetical protein GGI02_002883 [Coemansia sp. RSA 2322]|nr:hypothetical protein GGI02_002883 [Coemansia sp. RSA 2322]